MTENGYGVFALEIETMRSPRFRHISMTMTAVYRGHFSTRLVVVNHAVLWMEPAVRSVTLNLANKFSQCTFSVAEHYDLCRGLIIRQA